MIISTGTNGLNLPYNPLLSSGYTSGQFLRYTFGQGLSYSRNSSTMRDMYANANGTVRNQSSSLYYPNKYGADIIMGAYQGSSHDWWIGQTGYSSTQPYSVSRNGTFLSTLGTAPVVGRKYIACFGNSVSTSSTYFQLWDNAGNWYSSGNTVPAVSLSTAGVVAVGKYGGWNDNYMPRIYVGEAWYCTFLPYTTTWTLYNYIKKKYSGTWYNL